MNTAVRILAAGLLLLASCDQVELSTGTSLELRGVVLAAAAVDTVADERGSTDQHPGVMQVRVDVDVEDGDLSECDDGDDTFTVFWTEKAVFDPTSIARDASFPGNLVGRTVDLEAARSDVTPGRDDDEEEECVLVAERVTVGATQRATPAPAAGDETLPPRPAASPTAESRPTPTEEPAEQTPAATVENSPPEI